MKCVLALALMLAGCNPPVGLQADRTSVPADGSSLVHLTTAATIIEGSRFGRMIAPDLLRSTVLPGRLVLATGDQRLVITTVPVEVAEALHLDNPADQTAFRNWFTFLAEAQCFRTPLPKEVSDCAALIRYSYREALSVHNDAWIAAARLPFMPAIPAVDKYAYPFTPLGANLFRISDGNFAQFADAETLLRFNAHLIGRDVDRAEPGDILWFRQLSQRMPFHTMVYVGASQLDHTAGPYVVYHTGPGGEMRRVTVAELLHYPDPQWRPFPANSNFLGVYRWNIL